MAFMQPDYVKLKPIKPALRGYIAEAQALIKDSEITDTDAVHDIRVLMKKSRAVLKLIAHHSDYTYYERDIADLRAVGSILCCRRDLSVQRKILRGLRKEYPYLFKQLLDDPGLKLILEKQENLTEPYEELKNTFLEIWELLNKTGYRIRFQSMNTMDPQALLKEFELTYLTVSHLFLKSRNNPKPKTIHEFRKKAKDFLYQLYIFRSLNPSVVKVLEKKLESITQNLGRFNDLDQIIKSLNYKYHRGNNPPALDELMVKIREMQNNYINKVWTASSEIFYPGRKLVNLLGFKLLVIGS
jgi:CHAD domain-containing protein